MNDIGNGSLARARGVESLAILCYEDLVLCAPLFSHGVARAMREKVRAQYRRSLDRGRWAGSYAASNEDEFFAELTMWYFGTHGDLNMKGDKPANGPAGLQAYDPEAFAVLDDFYRGKMEPAASVEHPNLNDQTPPPDAP